MIIEGRRDVIIIIIDIFEKYLSNFTCAAIVVMGISVRGLTDMTKLAKVDVARVESIKQAIIHMNHEEQDDHLSEFQIA
jgi:hypothetical protein